MVTQAERDRMNLDATAALFETCTVRRRTTTGWTTVQADVPCRMRTRSHTRETMQEAASDGVAPCTTTLPSGTDVRRHDRIISQGRVMIVHVVQPEHLVHTVAHGQLIAAEVG